MDRVREETLIDSINVTLWHRERFVGGSLSPMKRINAWVVVSSTLAAWVCVPSNLDQEQGKAAVPARMPGELELEKGSTSIRPNWYQDRFGLVLEEEEGKLGHKLILTSRWENENVLIVCVRSTMESGVEPNLHFQIVDGRVLRCWVDGKWRADAGSKPSDFSGALHDVSGLARVNLKSGTLACLFTIRGNLWGDHSWEGGEDPDRVMCGFKLPLPTQQK